MFLCTDCRVRAYDLCKQATCARSLILTTTQKLWQTYFCEIVFVHWKCTVWWQIEIIFSFQLSIWTTEYILSICSTEQENKYRKRVWWIMRVSIHVICTYVVLFPNGPMPYYLFPFCISIFLCPLFFLLSFSSTSSSSACIHLRLISAYHTHATC